MEAKILDSFKEGNNTCYLSSIKLEDYLIGLPDDYDTYDVQREIVKNTYLDDLIKTIIQGNHIPPIVLVLEDDNFIKTDKSLSIKSFKILDGLQRTFRLKTIYKTVELFIKEYKEHPEILDFSKLVISKRYKEDLESFNSSTSNFVLIANHFKTELGKDLANLDYLFNRNQWFEIWTGLSPDDEVTKMLILNAGHKPVKTKHQLELLFRNIIGTLQKVDFKEFKVIREKEKSSIKYSKERVLGEFHFSHLITSLLSIGETKPLTSNINLIQKSQSDYFNDATFDKLLKLEFLKEFIRFLLDLDVSLSKHYQNVGIRWLSRETSLVGLFAAMGKYSETNKLGASDGLQKLREKIVNNPGVMKLDQFEIERNSLDLAKINIGNVNKKAVYNGVYDILIEKSNSIDWEHYFKPGK